MTYPTFLFPLNDKITLRLHQCRQGHVRIILSSIRFSAAIESVESFEKLSDLGVGKLVAPLKGEDVEILGNGKQMNFANPD